MKRPEIRRPDVKRPEPAKRPGTTTAAPSRPGVAAPSRPGTAPAARPSPKFSSLSPQPLPPGMDILEIIELLREVVETENHLLQERDFKEAAALQDRKTALSQLYERHLTAINHNPAVIQDLPEETRQKLRDASEKLKLASEINIRLLRSNMQAIEGVLNSIVAAIREQSTPISNYTAKGAVEENFADPTATSISLNNTF